MKQGKSVTCDRWVRDNSMLKMFLVPGDDANDPHIAWVWVDGKQSPMTYSHTNVLAEDWRIFNN